MSEANHRYSFPRVIEDIMDNSTDLSSEEESTSIPTVYDLRKQNLRRIGEGERGDHQYKSIKVGRPRILHKNWAEEARMERNEENKSGCK